MTVREALRELLFGKKPAVKAKRVGPPVLVVFCHPTMLKSGRD